MKIYQPLFKCNWMLYGIFAVLEAYAMDNMLYDAPEDD